MKEVGKQYIDSVITIKHNNNHKLLNYLVKYYIHKYEKIN